jgi:cobalt-zinc-cadmium efflux system outer membrane protein
LRLSGALASVLLTCPLRASPPADAPLEITPALTDQLLAEAQGRNPALAAAGAQADSAAAAADGVRTWDDPVATLGYSYFGPHGFSASENGNLAYGVQQRLPLFSRPRLAREAAEAGAARERLNLASETAKVRRDLTVGLLELASADETLALAGQDLHWLDAIRQTVDHRYQVGKASQVEWLKIETERETAADNLTTLQLERDHRAVELNRLLNRSLHASWPTVRLPDIPASVPSDDALMAAAVEADPDLKVMRQEIVQAHAAAQVTRRQRQPDISVGVQGLNYTGDMGLRQATATVNFSLPWLNAKRYDQDFQRDLSRAHASEGEAADYELKLRELVHHMAIDLDAARRQALLYRRSLIPLADQALASANAAWAGALGPFQDVLDARRMLVANRQTLVRARADAGKLAAELCLRTGLADLSGLAPSAASAESSMAMPPPSR